MIGRKFKDLPRRWRSSCKKEHKGGWKIATHKVQKEHFGEERYLRIQKMNGLKAGEAK